MLYCCRGKATKIEPTPGGPPHEALISPDSPAACATKHNVRGEGRRAEKRRPLHNFAWACRACCGWLSLAAESCPCHASVFPQRGKSLLGLVANGWLPRVSFAL